LRAISAPSNTAVVPEPGIPSARSGTNGPVQAALLALSGAGFLFASQDVRQSDSFWRLADVFGGIKTKLVCCSGNMLDELESGKVYLTKT
jgi:hypothetical protein